MEKFFFFLDEQKNESINNLSWCISFKCSYNYILFTGPGSMGEEKAILS